jgi:hypothetical protein
MVLPCVLFVGFTADANLRWWIGWVDAALLAHWRSGLDLPQHINRLAKGAMVDRPRLLPRLQELQSVYGVGHPKSLSRVHSHANSRKKHKNTVDPVR